MQNASSGTTRTLHHMALAICIAAMAVLAGPFALPASAHEYKAGSLAIDHPWTRATPAGAKVAAGFVTITNNGKTSDRLIGGSLATAARVEIHKMEMTDGVMTMGEVKGGVEIPSGKTVTLKPGGLHMMLMGLTAQPKKGERIEGSLVFEHAGTMEVEFAVEALGAKAPAGPGMKEASPAVDPNSGHDHH